MTPEERVDKMPLHWIDLNPGQAVRVTPDMGRQRNEVVRLVKAAIEEERQRWKRHVRSLFELVDRHVPTGDIPVELDEARAALDE